MAILTDMNINQRMFQTKDMIAVELKDIFKEEGFKYEFSRRMRKNIILIESIYNFTLEMINFLISETLKTDMKTSSKRKNLMPYKYN